MTSEIVWPDRRLFKFPRDIPKKVNWRAKGVLNRVRDQGKCNCCWAFVACGVIAACYKIKNEKDIILSPQDLVNCMELPKDKRKIQKDIGCFTSSINRAFRHIISNGVRYDAVCSYLGERKSSTPPQEGEPAFRIKTFVKIEDDDLVTREETILREVALHPVAAVIRVRKDLFQALYKKQAEKIFEGEPRSITEQYKEDVFSHAILIVGYGRDEEEKCNYWIIQNSQGMDWADVGFLRVCRDSSLPQDRDPLIMRASYPILF